DRVAARPADCRPILARPRVAYLEKSADSAFLTATLDRLEGEMASGFPPRDTMLEACLDIVLTLGATFDESGADPHEAATRDRIARLNTLIGRHYREHRPAAFYADKLGVSITHLNRIA